MSNNLFNILFSREDSTPSLFHWAMYPIVLFTSMHLFVVKSTCFAETVHICINPDKRITADISKDSMNRIAMTGDRITQVFGDSEAYELQTEETSGQIFIKPTLENGEKPLSMTLVTEKNITQDLLLNPMEKEASTLILKGFYKNMEKMTHDHRERGHVSSHAPFTSVVDPLFKVGEGPYSPTYQDTLLTAMKKLTIEQSSILQESLEPKRLPPKDYNGALTVSFKCAFDLGTFKGYAFEVQNITQTPIEITEDYFFQKGDLALSLDKHTLKSQETTNLFVVMEC